MKPVESCVSVLIDIQDIVREGYEGYGLSEEDEERILDLIESVFDIVEIEKIVDRMREEMEIEAT